MQKPCKKPLEICRSMFPDSPLQKSMVLFRAFRILFWHVTDDLYNAVQLVKTSDAFIARAFERKTSAEDIQAAQEAFKHL